jgi:hypothetical protein
MINATKYFIVFITLIIILFVASKAIISYDLVGNPESKGINIMIILLLIVTIITITGVSLSYTIQPKTKHIMPPMGERGIKGNRGNKGEKSKCGLKCTDDSCYMKVMNHITNVYNIWCKLDSSNRNSIPRGHHIDNLFIKKKVKEICGSRIFSELLKNHGDKKKDCLKIENIDNGNCGAYDYILQKWTEWILIILKYENGKLFIDTETLNDNNFNSMLTVKDLTSTDFKWVFPFSNKLWFRLFENPSTDLTKVDSMFKDNWGPNKYGVPSAKNKLSVKDLKSPFEEIQLYDAWYWGANPLSVPKIIRKCSNDDSESTPFKNTIKIRLSNDYNQLWSSRNAKQIKKKLNYNSVLVDTYVPRQSKGQVYKDGTNLSNGFVDVYRGRDFYDNGEEDNRYKSYKPVGDVMIIQDDANDNSNSNSNSKTDPKECYPRYLKSDYIQLGSNLNKSPKVLTLLVSGDTKKPIGYTKLIHFNRTVGFNAHRISYSFWRPIPPPGYVALGDVISTSSSEDSPSTDIIRCIPESCANKMTKELKQIYNLKDVVNEDTDQFLNKDNIFKSNTSSEADIPKTLNGNENNKKNDSELLNPEINQFLINYNVFRLQDMKEGGFYSINVNGIKDNSKVNNSNIKRITKKKHGIDYSILNIYNK